MVRRVQHPAAGAEIAGKEDFPPLSRFRFRRKTEGAVLFQENAGVRQAELINGLLHVTHQEQIMPLPGQRRKNRILHGVGILIFVHENFPEPAADLSGRRRWSGMRLAQQQFQGIMFQVPKIHNAAAFLGLGVVFPELPHQIGKALGRQSRLGKPRQDGFPAVGE